MRIFQESPHVNGGNRFIFQSFCSNFFSRAIDNGLKTIQIDISIDYQPTLDRYIERLSFDYRPSVNRPLTECRPISDRYIGKVLTNYRRSIGKKSAKCRWMKRYISRDTFGTTIDRVSTECRLTIVRLSTTISTDYRPSVDRLSTECRPSIDQVSIAISTAISTDTSVDTTCSKQDPCQLVWVDPQWGEGEHCTDRSTDPRFTDPPLQTPIKRQK